MCEQKDGSPSREPEFSEKEASERTRDAMYLEHPVSRAPHLRQRTCHRVCLEDSLLS